VCQAADGGGEREHHEWADRPDDFARVHAFNVTGPLLGIQHLAPLVPPGSSGAHGGLTDDERHRHAPRVGPGHDTTDQDRPTVAGLLFWFPSGGGHGWEAGAVEAQIMPIRSQAVASPTLSAALSAPRPTLSVVTIAAPFHTCS
jgi:NAD(P)-dependent dehydrogenase (short-subunit alcohol dehydrogenase family)